MERKGPYDFINLSFDSDTETATQIKKTRKAKVSDELTAVVKAIKQLIKIKDWGNIINKLDTMITEAKKSKDGIPMLALRTLHNLNELLKTSKEGDKENLKKLKKKMTYLMNQFANELEKAGDDLKKEEDPDDDAGATQEPIEGRTEKPTHERAEAKEQDFNERLRLSPDERRKFWMKKIDKKDVVTEKQDDRRKVRDHKSKEEKKSREEGEFATIRTDDVGIKARLKEYGNEKNFMREDEKLKVISILQFLTEKTEGERLTEVLILLVNMRLNQVYETAFVTVEESEVLIDNLTDLVEVGPGNKIVSYSKNNEKELTEKEVKVAIAKLLLAFDYEHQFTIKITSPFSEEYPTLITQETSILRLLKSARKFCQESQKVMSDLAIRELEHIHSLRTDLLEASEDYSKYFEDAAVQILAKELTEIVIQGNEEVSIAKAKVCLAHSLAVNKVDLEKIPVLLSECQKNSVISSDKFSVGIFNRAIGYLGLDLFEKSMFFEAKHCLENLLAAENLQELLCQFDPKKGPTWENPDPVSLLPYHLHLNIQELDTTFILLCILTESHYPSDSKIPHTERFSRFLSYYQKNLFLNSSNNIYDRLYNAYKKIRQFDSESALKLIESDFSASEAFNQKLREEVISESLFCFVESLNSLKKSTLNLKEVSEILKFPYENLTNYVKRKIEDKELRASLNGDFISLDNQEHSGTDSTFGFVKSLNAFNEILSKASNFSKNTKEQKSNLLFELSQIAQNNFERKEKPLNYQIANEIFKSKS